MMHSNGELSAGSRGADPARGKELVLQEPVPTSAPSEVMLDVTGLAVGSYTLHLSDAHTWIAGKKFIVE